MHKVSTRTQQKGDLNLSVYQGDWDVLPNFTLENSILEDTAFTFDVPEGEFVARVYSGYLYIPSTDMYMFALSSDDGSRLSIGGTVVVNNDGLHGAQVMNGTIALAEGWHACRVEWFNKTGGASLGLNMGVVGELLIPLPSSSLATGE
jgi:hypothetical protein